MSTGGPDLTPEEVRIASGGGDSVVPGTGAGSFGSGADEVALAGLPREHGVPTGLAEADVLLEGAAIRGRTQWEIFWRRFVRHRVGMVAGVVLAVMALMAIVWPLISPWGFDDIDVLNAEQPPGWPHIFGTGEAGKDVFTMVMYGGRISLLVGLATALVATVFGSLLGAVAGYAGGWGDGLISRMTDIFLTVPALAALIALASISGELSLAAIILVIAALSWMPVTRLVRAEFLGLKERDFVQAARAVGASPGRVVGRHLLPNAASTIIVSATLLVGIAILTESTLSFLGIGLNPLENTSWGTLLTDSRDNVLRGQWWLLVFPGAAIVTCVLCVNFVGDALRDALDPYGVQGHSKKDKG